MTAASVYMGASGRARGTPVGSGPTPSPIHNPQSKIRNQQGLAARHPVRLMLGFTLMLRDVARRLRQPTLVVLSDKAVDCAHRATRVTCAIVRESGNGELLVEEVARDGVITETEARQLRGMFAEIGTEAREGRIL